MNLDAIIKENPGINLTVEAGDLMEFGQNIASHAAQTVLNNHEEKIYTRDEVMQKFNVCNATLWLWDRIGSIIEKKLVIGNIILRAPEKFD